MFRVRRTTGKLDVHAGDPLPTTSELTRAVDLCWRRALQEEPHLFDDPALTVLSMNSTGILTARISYRHIIAARRSPEIAQALNLRPLAVSGVLTCPDGLVVGQRSRKVTQGAGLWELVPSGGIEPPPLGEHVELKKQILRELEEEVGIGAKHVTIGDPVGILEDQATGVVDIVIPMRTSFPEPEISRIHATLDGREYSGLTVARASELMSGNQVLLPETRIILERLYPEAL